jgi:hypothetical protein
VGGPWEVMGGRGWLWEVKSVGGPWEVRGRSWEVVGRQSAPIHGTRFQDDTISINQSVPIHGTRFQDDKNQKTRSVPIHGTRFQDYEI